MMTNVYELMNCAHATEYCPIINDHVAGNLCVITENAIISYNTIVRQMAICLDKTIFPDHSFFTVLRAAVNGNKFPDSCIIANKNIGIFALKFQILRNGANNSAGKNAAIFTNSRTLHDSYIRTNPCSFTDFNILVDNCKRVNFYICS